MHSHTGTFSLHKSVKDKNFNHIHSLERLFLKPAHYGVMSVQSIHHLCPWSIYSSFANLPQCARTLFAPTHPKILHKHCLQFLLGRLQYPGEMKNKGYVKFWGVNMVHYACYGRCASGEWQFTQSLCACAHKHYSCEKHCLVRVASLVFMSS